MKEGLDPSETHTGFMKEGLEPDNTGFMKEGIDPNQHRIYEGRPRA